MSLRRLKDLLSPNRSARPSSGASLSSESGMSTSSNTDSSDPLRSQPYYHGMLPREDTETLLQNAGDFLLRTTEVDGRKTLTLSVRVNGRVEHFIVRQMDSGMWQLSQRPFGSVADLVEFYASTKQPIIEQRPDAVLLHPLPRQHWQLKHDQIDRKQRVGSGAFGEVWMASLRLDTGRYRRVAVKCLPVGVVADKTQRETLMREARLMRNYAHRNIIRLLGVAVDQEPLMLVLEWAPLGALSDYLRAHHAQLGPEHRLRFCIQATQGLRYLEKHGTIHRDVAARNCLLSADLEVKIADFGLSQPEAFYKERRGSKLPIRWLAPESLAQGVFTLKSDVWSFGILVCEVFSGGQEPYPGMTTAEVHRAVLKDGYRQPIPDGTPDGVSEVVARCWSENPDARPNFLDLKLQLRRVYDRLCTRFNLRRVISDRISPKRG